MIASPLPDEQSSAPVDLSGYDRYDQTGEMIFAVLCYSARRHPLQTPETVSGFLRWTFSGIDDDTLAEASAFGARLVQAISEDYYAFGFLTNVLAWLPDEGPDEQVFENFVAEWVTQTPFHSRRVATELFLEYQELVGDGGTILQEFLEELSQ